MKDRIEEFWGMSDKRQSKFLNKLNGELKKEFLQKYHWFDEMQLRDVKFGHIDLFGYSEQIIYNKFNIEYNRKDIGIRDHNYVYRKIICKAKDVVNDPEVMFVLDKYKDYHIMPFHTNKTEEELLNDPLIKTNDVVEDETNVIIVIINRRIVSSEESLTNLRRLVMNAEKLFISNKRYGGFIKSYINQNNVDNDAIVKIQKKLSETQLEDLTVKNIDRVENGMKVIATQHPVENGFIDILAEDKNGTKCIIELKITDSCKDIVFQSAYYPSQFVEKVRMITICPNYKDKIYKALSNMNGVEMKTYYFNQVDDQIHIDNYEVN